jgi:hypothetical protein
MIGEKEKMRKLINILAALLFAFITIPFLYALGVRLLYNDFKESGIKKTFKSMFDGSW